MKLELLPIQTARRTASGMRVRAMAAALLLTACAATAGARDYHVNARHTSASDANEGTAAAPLLTITRAVALLERGDRIIVGEGLYRETIDLRKARFAKEGTGGAPRPTTTIEGAGAGRTIISAAELITDWEPAGPDTFVRRGWGIATQVVTVDGKPITQIGGTIFGGVPDNRENPLSKLHASQGGIWPGRKAGGRAELVADSFYYEDATGDLWLKLGPGQTPAGRAIEVAARSFGLIASDISDLTVRGLEFRYSNYTHGGRQATVAMRGNRLTVENINVSLSDGICLNVAGDDNVLRGNRLERCGQVGMMARGRRVKVLDNVLQYNNWRGFNKWWEAGGAKFIGNNGLQDSEVRGNLFAYNTGDGLWLDWGNRGVKVTGNVAAYNSGMGIHFEASFDSLIERNTVYANGQRGIYLPHSSGTLVTGNRVIANVLGGVIVIDENRRTADLDLVPKDNRIEGNIIGWSKTMSLILPHPISTNKSNGNFFATHNAMERFSVGWPGKTKQGARTIAEWRAESGMDTESVAIKARIPEGIASAIAEQRLITDWSSVDALFPAAKP